MVEEIVDKYANSFGEQPQEKIQAPGRINIIGEHTDYNLGYVLPAAIDKYTFFALGVNGTNQVNIISADYGEKMSLPANTKSVESGGWQKYMESVLIGLYEAGFDVKGFNLVFGGNIPIGAGVSSSAALTCGLIYGLSQLFDLGISKKDIAKLGQAAEIRVGLNCGLMDQYAVLFSKKDHCLLLDCRSLEIKYYPANLNNYSIVLLDTNVTHELVDSEYNNRRSDVESAVDSIKKRYKHVESARDVSFEMLKNLKTEIDPQSFNKLEFVIEENDRVLKTCEAFEKNDFESVGSYVNGSHTGLSEKYEVSCKELDFLANYAHKNKHVLGSRMMGGGFGGCTINIVRKGFEDDFIESARSAYSDQIGLTLKAYKINLGEGLKRI